MKLKFLFLGMVAAAAMISCNNDVIENGPDNDTKGLPQEGLPVYASVYFDVFNGSGPSSRAGQSEVGASADEKLISNAAMYIYKFDGVSTSPQTYVYVTSIADTITMKATSGTKKIFVAVNIAQGTQALVNYTSPSPLALSYDVLNNALYANSSTTWDLLPSTALTPNFYKADGLIKGLAKDEIFGNQSGSYSGTYNMLMTNWDGPDDVALSSPASIFESNCVFPLYPDIDSLTSRFPPSGALKPARDSINNFDISVQRAFAKVSLQLTVPAPSAPVPALDTVGDFSNDLYAAGDLSYKGIFQPWGVRRLAGDIDATPIWILGNIHKETLPFQKYVSGVIRDLNYDKTNDSIPLDSAAFGPFNMWTTRYDNTRIFPFDATTINSYPNVNLTVGRVKAQMLLAGNFQYFTTPSPGNTYFAYTIENARKNPVAHDYGSYVVIGGRYNPEQIVTDIVRANLPSNPPTMTTATGYSKQLSASDTMFYVTADQIFILGEKNLIAYYAWYKAEQPTADPNNDFGTLEPFDPALVARVNTLIRDNKIMRYMGGQCYYRVFIGDLDASAAEMRAVRRNHIYAINIIKILGPGIDDPNEILIPGKPIDDLDTYVTARINILNWHQVDQVVTVDMN